MESSGSMFNASIGLNILRSVYLHMHEPVVDIIAAIIVTVYNNNEL